VRVADALFGIGWIVFWVYWFAAAIANRGRGGRARGFTGARVALIVLALILLRNREFRGHTTNSNPWLLAIGLVLFVSGLLVAVWARVNLGRNWGTPMSKKPDPELVTSGPYRSVRHPIYSGIVLAMIGTAVGVSVYWLIAVIAAGGYFVYSAFREERYMIQSFPDTYPDYKRSTKMLVPFVF
jgi:protein-S-isoprenylcysteine O-methyltransferase Ste14